MATISELRDRFLSMMGDKREAAKAATLNLEPAPALDTGVLRRSAPASDYFTIDSSSWAPFAGTTITFTTDHAVPAKEVVVPPQPTPQDVLPGMDAGESAAYRRTCQAVGYEPAALVAEELLAFMQEKRMKRYDNAKVDEYLTAKAKKALGSGGVWYWKPLRAQDVGKEHEEHGATGGWGESTSKKSRKTPYQQAIPLRVLGRVEQFIQKFGDKVRFLVSDYAEQKPDPFIAVIPKQGGVDPIVFDVWDEPDFK